MTIKLTREQEQFIEQALSTGHFSDKGKVIEEALTLLKRQGEARVELQADIQESLDDLADDGVALQSIPAGATAQ